MSGTRLFTLARRGSVTLTFNHRIDRDTKPFACAETAARREQAEQLRGLFLADLGIDLGG